MKALKCEMCNSGDFVKEGDLFVCQCCGTKYTVEAAKKLMVEIDNSKKISNLYERARKSVEVGDLKHAAEYYKQILDENPNDWEAYFYSYLGEFTTYTNIEASTVALKLGNTIPSAYDMAIANGNESDEDSVSSRVETITTMTTDRLLTIAQSAIYLLKQYDTIGFGAAASVNMDLFDRMRPMVVNTVASCVISIDKICNKLEDLGKNGLISDEIKKKCTLYARKIKYSIESTEFTGGRHLFTEEDIINAAKEVKELDPMFGLPQQIDNLRKQIENDKKNLSLRKKSGIALLIFGIVLSIIFVIMCIAAGIKYGIYGIGFLVIGIVFIIWGFVAKSPNSKKNLELVNSINEKEKELQSKEQENKKYQS